MIKKYTLTKYGTTEIVIGIRQVLDVQMQNDDLVVWVDDQAPERLWTFHSIFTGDNAPNARYIGTVQDKSLVYHVFVA